MNTFAGKSSPISSHLPSVALVADVRGWALDNIAQQLIKRLGDTFSCRFFCVDEYSSLKNLTLELFSGDFTIVHFLWRKNFLQILPHIIESPECVQSAFADTKVTFSVYDHLFLGKSDVQRYKALFGYLADGYTVSSQRLFSVYSAIGGYPPPDMIIEDGVDTALFHPVKCPQRSEQTALVMVGWAGNSRWGINVDGIDHKGLMTIIKPAIERLRQEGIPVLGKFVDSTVCRRPLADMATFYNSIDIYVCASDMEGTPNPVLEAMACGVPVISTDVGIVPQVFGQLQQEFIVRERSVPAFAERIRLLVQNPSLRAALNEENIRQIQGWTRESESLKWERFFRKMLDIPPDGIREVLVGGKVISMPRRELKLLCLAMPYSFWIEKIDSMKATLSWKLTAPLRKLKRLLR